MINLICHLFPEITQRNDRWYVVSKKKNYNEIDKNKTDVIFNALHGKYGEDGIAQSYFECLRIPYTHSGVISSYLSLIHI